MIKRSKFLLFCFYFYVFISLFPVFQYFGVSYYIILSTSIISIIVYNIIFYNIYNIKFIYVSIILLACSSITSLYWGGSYKISLYPLPLIIGLYYAMTIDANEYDNIVTLFTILSIIMLIGSYIGFIYAFFGGKPILIIKNPDNRDSWLYITTFTNTRIGNIIRPSGLFDEPGAFSFFICITAMLRNITKRSSKLTLYILLFGFITLSLAHFVFIIFYFISIIENKKKYLRNTLISIIAFLLFLSFTNVGKIIYNNLYYRILNNIDISSSNKDIRFLQFQNAYEELASGKIDNILFSIDPSFMDKNKYIPRKNYPRMGENVLSPLAYYGILISWIYYIVIIKLIKIAFKKKENVIYLGLAMLLMQRPYVTTIGYSAIIFLPLFMKYKLSKKSKITNVLHAKKIKNMAYKNMKI